MLVIIFAYVTFIILVFLRAEHILQYIRGLERRLEVAEEGSSGGGGGGGGGSGPGEEPGHVSRPDAVVQAMRVLEVQEHLEWESASLERPPQEQQEGAPRMEDPEKALLRQMCNVSYRDGQCHTGTGSVVPLLIFVLVSFHGTNHGTNLVFVSYRPD